MGRTVLKNITSERQRIYLKGLKDKRLALTNTAYESISKCFEIELTRNDKAFIRKYIVGRNTELKNCFYLDKTRVFGKPKKTTIDNVFIKKGLIEPYRMDTYFEIVSYKLIKCPEGFISWESYTDKLQEHIKEHITNPLKSMGLL